MEYKAWLLMLFAIFFPLVHSFNNSTSSESLDVLLQNLAFDSLLRHRPHTGALYKARVPKNLAGMEISVIRLRSGTLWRKGANFSHIHIPPKTIPVPNVRRIFIVYQDFGNWSSQYYNLRDYSLISNVIGFSAYDASNLSSNRMTKLGLNVIEGRIEIQFPNLMVPEGAEEKKTCIMFSPNGTVQLSHVGPKNNCYGRSEGYFSIVSPVRRRERRVWGLWAVGFALGFVGLVAVGFVGAVATKFVRRKRVNEMEREADDGEGLETVWIGSSKMPSATFIRTHPVLENASLS
ncbi:hypothetical protein NMG60_11027005 [Bertholletia excelsa]